MRRPPFTPTAVRRAIGALQTTPKEKPVLSIEQLKDALALQAVQANQLLSQLSQLSQANQQLAATLQARDKEIEALKAKVAPPTVEASADSAAGDKAPRQPVEAEAQA